MEPGEEDETKVQVRCSYTLCPTVAENYLYSKRN